MIKRLFLGCLLLLGGLSAWALPPELASRIAAGEGDDRVAALNALLQMDAESAMPILKKVLARRDPCSIVLRRKAVFLVSQKRTPETIDILLGAARNDPDSEVREQAVFWLSQVGTDRAVGALDSILHASKDPGLQEKALFALSQDGSPRARQALRSFAERGDVPADIREKAIFWIGQSGGAESSAYLRTLYGRLKEESLRNKVLFAVSQAGGAENVRWLLGVARDGKQSLELRKQAQLAELAEPHSSSMRVRPSSVAGSSA